MTSALDYVLHEEVTNNSDSYWCSFFLHKPKDSKGGKVTLGPAWDFNLAMSNGGGMGSTSTEGWQIENPQKQGQGGMMMMGGGLKAPNWLIGMWKLGGTPQRSVAYQDDGCVPGFHEGLHHQGG